MWTKPSAVNVAMRRWSGVGIATALSAGLMLTPARAEPKPADDVAAQVQRQLAFGEFGRAVDAAQGVADPKLRDQLLQKVANAQLQAGDHAGSLGTTRRMEGAELRSSSRTQQARQQQMFGGGAPAVIASIIIGAVAAAAVGAVLATFTERSKIRTALRQVLVAAIACAFTSFVGSLLGSNVA